MTAADAFRAWRPLDPPITYDAFRAGFLACAAEAERLCRENTKVCGHPGALCHLMDGNDIRAKLAEVDRGG